MNKILPAIRDVDILNGVRRVIATDGKLCIAGLAYNFRYFVEKYLSADERTEAANYLQDERGRDVKIFLGYVVKGSGVPDVSDSKLWQMFKQTVATVWERNPFETVIVPYESCGTKSVASKPLDKKFYPSNERDDLDLFRFLYEDKNKAVQLLYKKCYELRWLEAHWAKCKALFDNTDIELATCREVLKIFLLGIFARRNQSTKKLRRQRLYELDEGFKVCRRLDYR